jgi:translation initiation factor 4B
MVPAEDEEESDPTAIVTDKAVKPKEVIRDARPPKTNGAWRNNNGNRRDAPAPKAAAPAPESTTNSMEEDGWSTVTSTKKTNTKTTNRRGGGGGRGDRSGGDNAPARAIAS